MSVVKEGLVGIGVTTVDADRADVPSPLPLLLVVVVLLLPFPLALRCIGVVLLKSSRLPVRRDEGQNEQAHPAQADA